MEQGFKPEANEEIQKANWKEKVEKEAKDFFKETVLDKDKVEFTRVAREKYEDMYAEFLGLRSQVASPEVMGLQEYIAICKRYEFVTRELIIKVAVHLFSGKK